MPDVWGTVLSMYLRRNNKPLEVLTITRRASVVVVVVAPRELAGTLLLGLAPWKGTNR